MPGGSKVTPGLAARQASASPEDLIDVVVELRPSPGEARRGRAAIDERKSAFERESAPVEEAVRQAGGQVLGAVWLNQTLKVRVPARALDQLSSLAPVQALDVPRPLSPENR